MSRFGVRDILDVTIRDFTTGKPVLVLKSLKSSSLESAAETVYARGGHGNPKLLGWDSSRDEKFMFQDALISPEGLGLLFGATPVTGATVVNTSEVLTVTAGNVITLSHTPTGTLGADKWFFTTTDGASLGAEHVYAASPATGKYQITGAVVTLYTDVPVGTLILANYSYTTAATNQKIIIDATKFPGTYKVTGECFFRLETGVDVPANFTIHKMKILPGFTISMATEGESSVFNFEGECLKAVGSTNMVEINIIQ